MLLRHSCAIISETEIVVQGIAAKAAYCDDGTLPCIGDGIVEQIAEDGVYFTRIAHKQQRCRQFVLHAHSLLGKFVLYLLLYAANHLCYIHLLFIYLLQGIIHIIKALHILYQGIEAVALRVATLQKVHHLLGCEVGGVVFQYCFQIALNTAYRCFELVGHILCQLPFNAALLLGTRYIVYGYLETAILEQHATQGKCAPRDINLVVHGAFACGIVQVAVVVYKALYLAELGLGKDITRIGHMLCRYEIAIFTEKAVCKNQPFAMVEEGKPLLCYTQMHKQFLRCKFLAANSLCHAIHYNNE